MEILSEEEAMNSIDDIVLRIRQGKVFIYPTDTIYGIGCNAIDGSAVARVREIKKRNESPFSVIAPSKQWIRENCIIGEEWLKKLPGSYTLILRLRNTHAVAPNVSMGSTLGVRIPDCWFSEVISKTGIPLISTSANIHGEKFMTSLENLSPDVGNKVDFVIYEGEKHGMPSKIIDLTGDSPKEIIR
ncbi:threonylcarbamoyl-AMP synthase [Candidatus Woesearchaeota archaeon]|nr:threonylcarbamoyl-AMP synthase [Candidatus Woesearchaeota archaeon]